MTNLDKLRAEKQAFENFLFSYVDKKEFSSTILKEAILYSLKRGGKRIRPLLCIATSRVQNHIDEKIYEYASSLELIHNYSLVHDDLPAMDNDEYRRGVKTTHILYGEDIGILAGDALFSLAVENSYEDLLLHSTYGKLQAYKYLFDMAGSNGMIDGQAFEIESNLKENREKIIYKKTGMLFMASIVGTAYYLEYKPDIITILAKLASDFGKSFQMLDDLMDNDGGASTYEERVLTLNQLRDSYSRIADIIGELEKFGNVELFRYITNELFEQVSHYDQA